ncbi:unnamed protein product, partial [Polarella glacialis]
VGSYMHCMICRHDKPTISTMGQLAHKFYPLADQKMACEGQRNCHGCHAIIHASHAACLACKDRAATKDAHQKAQDMIAKMSSEPGLPAILPPPPQLALAAPAPAVDEEQKKNHKEFAELLDKYQGMDPEAVLADLERMQKGLPMEAPRQMSPEEEAAAERVAEQ